MRRALAVSVTFLLRASAPAVVRISPAARIAVTFWLTAECVRCTDRASSVIVIGPYRCSRISSITKLGRTSPRSASVYSRAMSASIASNSSLSGRHTLCSVGSGPRFSVTEKL